MCLYIDRVKMGVNWGEPITEDSALIANRPLIVRKIMANTMSGKLVTPYRQKPMELGVRYDVRKHFDICEGAYRDSIEGGGFHALLTTATSGNCKWLSYNINRLFYGIVPAGTKFFLGVDQDVVVKSIILYGSYREMVAAHGTPVPRKDALPVIHYTQRAPK